MKSKFNFFLKCGDSVMFDAATNQLLLSSGSGEPRSVTLSYSESRLLQLLLDNPGETRSRNEIMEYAWDNRVVAAGSLNQAIFTLRNLIDDGTDHDLLQTVPRRGYRFNAQYLADDSANEAGAASPELPDDSPREVIEPDAELAAGEMPRQLIGLFGSRRLLVPAYALMFCLLVLVALYRTGVLGGATPDLVIEDVKVGPLTYHFIGESEEENATAREAFRLAMETGEEGLEGDIWINKSNRLYDLSCVRAGGVTENLIFREDNTMANLELEMVRRCMRGWR
ncbi:winged helix-turn-helix domain-containing protein [Pseudomonas sp. LFM046]|uniref:winged helix-turn-helix domain-containing protein n=1 Tax=Pseudomonas sp. LFM046 TaxID=1608357 RepID=UPI0009E3E044|nr:winged helix-turn-helix domain-containing protein [Pseudomonas sp. LFM046]